MNKKIFALLILASLNLALPLWAMMEESPKKESVITNPSKEIWQQVFNAHALRLVPPAPTPEESSSSSSSWFFFQKEKAASPVYYCVSKAEKKNTFYALQTILQEAHKIGVSLDILKVPVNKETDVWPIHKAAKKGHSLIETVANLYPEALSAESSQLRFFRDTPHSIVEKITQENPQKSDYLERLYQVHQALKKIGKLDDQSSETLWTSIINQLIELVNDTPEQKTKIFAMSSSSFGSASGSYSSFHSPLLDALQYTHQLGMVLGKKLSPGQHIAIFEAAMEKGNPDLILAAKHHGMVPSSDIIENAKARAMDPKKCAVGIRLLQALLSDPVKTEEMEHQKAAVILGIE